MGLEVASRLDQVSGTDHPSDPPPGHGVGLSHAVDGHEMVVDFGDQRPHGVVHVVVVGQVLVDLVGEHPDAVLDGPPADGLDLVGWVDRSRRVGRGDEEERLGVRGASLLQLVDGDTESRGGVGSQRHGRGAGQGDGLWVGGPVRRRQQDLVTRVQHRGTGVVHGVLAAVGDQDPRRLGSPPRVPLGLVDQSFLQCWEAPSRRVFVIGRVLACRHSGGHDMAWRGKVRLTRAEADDRFTGRLESLGLGIDGHSRRLGDGGDASGESFGAHWFSWRGMGEGSETGPACQPGRPIPTGHPGSAVVGQGAIAVRAVGSGACWRRDKPRRTASSRTSRSSTGATTSSNPSRDAER